MTSCWPTLSPGLFSCAKLDGGASAKTRIMGNKLTCLDIEEAPLRACVGRSLWPCGVRCRQVAAELSSGTASLGTNRQVPVENKQKIAGREWAGPCSPIQSLWALLGPRGSTGTC